MKIISALILSLLMAGCAGHWPECNNKYPESAKLRIVADDMHKCLQDVGTGLIIANGYAITVAELYTAEQALIAVDEWILALQEPIPDVDFRAMVYEQVGSFPELIILTDAFVPTFSTGNPIDVDSRQILIDYLSKRVRPILLQRINQ